MASTINIPLTTIPAGTHDFPASGGVTASARYNTVDVTIDRTVTGGLDSLTPAVSLTMSVLKSTDGGTTWITLASTSTVGGQILNKHTGLPFTFTEIVVTYGPASGDLLRGELTVSGSSVAVQGSVVFS